MLANNLERFFVQLSSASEQPLAGPEGRKNCKTSRSADRQASGTKRKGVKIPEIGIHCPQMVADQNRRGLGKHLSLRGEITRPIIAVMNLAFRVLRNGLGGYRHLPIVGKRGEPVGIISARDVLRHLRDDSKITSAF
ncbi:MAG: CBS domain-containing protein [Planctomycetia bacterium]|nr:CBS domain-containing protein [Planctomycetia bacterium]